MNAACDLLVIGAGPAGMAAAATAATLGVDVTLVDEQAAPGGQVHRGIESRAAKAGSVSQEDDECGSALAAEFRASGATYRPGTQVWQLERDGRVQVTDGERASAIQAQRVIIATGAMERPVPLPGWTLPGVMTVGAAQIRLKTAGWLPPAHAWVAGSGPLLWLYAAQVIEAGGRIAGVLDTAPPENFTRAIGHAWVPCATTPTRGRRLQRIVHAAGVPVVRNVSELEASGDTQLASVRYRVNGAWREAEAALLLLHHGVVPQTHASRSLGARHAWHEAQRCFVPVTDAWGNLDVERYAVAGDGAGIVGAQASLLQGRLAALEAARSLGAIDTAERDRQAVPLRTALARHLPARPFLDALFAPRASLLAPHDDVRVCRCESISAGELRRAVALGAMGPNQVKAFTRCGMGPCQGRMCGLPAAEIIATARGAGMAETGLFNVRPPLKPLSLAELSALE